MIPPYLYQNLIDQRDVCKNNYSSIYIFQLLVVEIFFTDIYHTYEILISPIWYFFNTKHLHAINDVTHELDHLLLLLLLLLLSKWVIHVNDCQVWVVICLFLYSFNLLLFFFSFLQSSLFFLFGVVLVYKKRGLFIMGHINWYS